MRLRWDGILEQVLVRAGSVYKGVLLTALVPPTSWRSWEPRYGTKVVFYTYPQPFLALIELRLAGRVGPAFGGVVVKAVKRFI